MARKELWWTTALSFGGAVVLGLLAVLLFARSGAREASAWSLAAAALCLLLVGVKAGALVRVHYASVERLEERVSHLSGQLDRQRSAVDSLADGLDLAILICDAKAHIVYSNRYARDMFRAADLTGRSVLAITLSYELEQLILDASRHQAPQQAELTFAYPAEHVGLAKAWPAEDDTGRVFMSIYEVTDLRRLERIRQDFVSNVSHELRTPMTIIRAMAETLLDDDKPAPDNLKNYLGKIIAEVDRLSTISNDLLILSTAESNPVRKHACDIADVFRTVVDQLAGKARDKGLIVEYSGPETFTIEANTAQMTQVALNLIDNAVNYTNVGSVRVEVAPGDLMVDIHVRDTGIGISSEHVGRVFERFYRVDKGRSRSSGGTGLGLSIVKHIVEAHGGAVRIESELNKGTSVTVHLPVGKIGREE